MSIDLTDLKTTLQTIFRDANTTTATRDLSSGMDTRVQHVLRVNPTLIPVQADWYPYVSVYVAGKNIEAADFAGSQLLAKREGKVMLKIVGGVWNTVCDDPAVDEADNDCDALMENIEEILRRNDTLVGKVTWQFPTRCDFYNASLGEGNALRAGQLEVEATILY